MKLSDMPLCSYVNSRGVRCHKRCKIYVEQNDARCSEHKSTKNNKRCQFVMIDGSYCPNYHHTAGIICSCHGTSARIEYLKMTPGVIVNQLNIQEYVPYVEPPERPLQRTFEQ